MKAVGVESKFKNCRKIVSMDLSSFYSMDKSSFQKSYSTKAGFNYNRISSIYDIAVSVPFLAELQQGLIEVDPGGITHIGNKIEILQTQRMFKVIHENKNSFYLPGPPLYIFLDLLRNESLLEIDPRLLAELMVSSEFWYFDGTFPRYLIDLLPNFSKNTSDLDSFWILRTITESSSINNLDNLIRSAILNKLKDSNKFYNNCYEISFINFLFSNLKDKLKSNMDLYEIKNIVEIRINKLSLKELKKLIDIMTNDLIDDYGSSVPFQPKWEWKRNVIDRFNSQKFELLENFAPYLHFYLILRCTAFLASYHKAKEVGTVSNYFIDLTYVDDLPFYDIFISDDKQLRYLSKIFKREDQKVFSYREFKMKAK